jgi:hypothetical protein
MVEKPTDKELKMRVTYQIEIEVEVEDRYYPVNSSSDDVLRMEQDNCNNRPFEVSELIQSHMDNALFEGKMNLKAISAF